MAPVPFEAIQSTANLNESMIHEHKRETRQRLPRPFVELFRAAHHMLTARNQPSAEELSLRYRSLILDCKHALSETQNDLGRDLASVIDQALKVWHFIEIVYARDRTQSEDHISVDLVEWFAGSFPDHLSAPDILSECASFSDNELWDFIAKCVVTGNLPTAHQIAHSRMKTNGESSSKWAGDNSDFNANRQESGLGARSLFAHFDSLLAMIPSNTVHARRDRSWNRWQSLCRTWATSEELADDHHAKRVFLILSGDSDSIAAICSTWEEMLVACSVFLPDEVGIESSLHSGLQTVMTASAEASIIKDTPKGGVGLALAEASMGNCLNAITAMEISLPTMWFSAHLGELLLRIGQMPDRKPDTNSNGPPISTKESLFIKFAEELENYPGLWRLASDYYMACPVLGDARLAGLLLRVKADEAGGMMAEKVLHLCYVRKLTKTARRIQLKLGSNCLEFNNLGGAISWYSAAGALREAQKVVDLALQAAEREGPDSNGALLLSNVVNAINKFANEEMRQAFDYLDVYKDMQDQLNASAAIISQQEKDQEPREALSETILPALESFLNAANSLLVSGGLPRRYWCVVVFEAARVLDEFPEALRVFNRSTLFNLINAVELCTGPRRCSALVQGLRNRLNWEKGAGVMDVSDLSSGTHFESLEDTLSYCRRVLSQAIARTINQS